jgi:uncharacterized protein (TIGR02001 family)
MKLVTKALVRAGLVSVTVIAAAVSAQTPPPATPAAAPAPAAAPTPEHTFTPKVSLYSEYEYRGISQTSEKPAVQLNLDYAHSSGFYAGVFASNINWLKDYKNLGLVEKSSAVEIDLFGGYKTEIVKDLTLDVGYLRYEYPGAKAVPKFPKPTTNELYIGLGYGPVSVKYSYSLGGTFGVPISKGSNFIEINLAQEIAPKVTLIGNIGRQQYKGNFEGFNNDKELTYTVYKIGANYDIGDGWTAGGYFKDTNAKEVNYTFKGRDWSKGRLVAFVSKSF